MHELSAPAPETPSLTGIPRAIVMVLVIVVATTVVVSVGVWLSYQAPGVQRRFDLAGEWVDVACSVLLLGAGWRRWAADRRPRALLWPGVFAVVFVWQLADVAWRSLGA